MCMHMSTQMSMHMSTHSSTHSSMHSATSTSIGMSVSMPAPIAYKHVYQSVYEHFHTNVYVLMYGFVDPTVMRRSPASGQRCDHRSVEAAVHMHRCTQTRNLRHGHWHRGHDIDKATARDVRISVHPYPCIATLKTTHSRPRMYALHMRLDICPHARRFCAHVCGCVHTPRSTSIMHAMASRFLPELNMFCRWSAEYSGC